MNKKPVENGTKRGVVTVSLTRDALSSNIANLVPGWKMLFHRSSGRNYEEGDTGIGL